MTILVAAGLFLLGLLLIALDFVLPSLGMLAISGGASVLGSIYLAYEAWGGIGAVVFGVAALCSLPVVVNQGLRRLTLNKSLEHSGGYTGVKDMQYLIGKRGMALTDLRPAGAARIDDARIDVLSESGQIDHDTPVQVLRVEGNRVIVGPVA